MKGWYNLLLFFSMSFLGWLMEVICKKIQYGRLINRGFLIGPYCPIYGVGSVLIVLLLEKYAGEPIAVLLLAMVICGTLEYLTSYMMEKLFHARWWDYSHKRFNLLNGRVCAGTLIPFGLLGIMLVYVIKPFLFEVYAGISPGKIRALCAGLSFLFAADVLVSTNILGKIRSTANLSRADNTEALTKAVRETLFRQSALHRRTFRAFPYVRIYNKPLLVQLRNGRQDFIITDPGIRWKVREMEHRTVSLIIPVYNGEQWIDRCMKSICSQSFVDFEAIVINDGSTDGSLRILQEWEKREKRLRLFTTKNKGVSAARNLGLSKARGKYIRFLDCDDTMPSTALAELVEAAETTGAELVIAPFYEVKGTQYTLRTLIANGGVLNREEYISGLKQYPRSFFYSVLWNKLYRREAIVQSNIRFDESISWSEDFLFNVHYLACVHNVVCLEEPVYDYHHHSSGLTIRFGRNIVFHPLKAIPLFRRLLADYTACCLNGKADLKEWLSFFRQTHGV